jgi:hypothetical protein
MRWLARVKAWFAGQWKQIRPGPEARRGAVWGTLAAAAACVIIAGLYMQTGFGYLFDFALALIIAAVLVPLVMLVVALLLTIARHLPRLATGMMIGAGTVIMLAWMPPQLGFFMALLAGIAEGFLGAAIATLVAGRFGAAAWAKKIITVCLLVLGIAFNTWMVWFFAHQGSLGGLAKWKPPTATMPAALQVADPSTPGAYPVRTLFYGAGSDIRRPEYGPSVAIKTHTVDASEFFKDFKGWKRWARRKYWGFDMDKLPLNGRVWYPDGPGPFPLALIVHGNHEMTDFSDPGYAYLGELLASRGFILASIDENFLNSGLFHDPPKQQPVRGWMLREHLKLWRDWSTAAGNPVASYQEDADLTTTTAAGGHIDARGLSIWHEGKIPWRGGDRDYNGVTLGWNRAKGAAAPVYEITLPDGAAPKWGLAKSSTLELSLAAIDQDAPLPGKKKDDQSKDNDKAKKKEREPPDFTIELVTADGVTAAAPASRFAAIPPPLKEKFTKLKILDNEAYEKDWEPVLGSVRAPLAALENTGPKAFDPARVTIVRLKFDRTPMSVITISGIGFGQED